MISLRIGVCHPNTRSHVRLLGPCFKTGRTTPVAATILAHSAPGGAGSGEASTQGPLGSCRARGRWRACWRGLNRSCYRGPRTKRGPEHQSGTLASNDFTYYFTFFSKFFSSFPHGTCSLSVSRKYLALEGHYLPVSAAVPSNTTHGKGLWWGRSDGTGLLPSPVRYLNNELHRNPFKRPIPDHNSAARGCGFSY